MELVINGVLISLEDPASRSGYRSETVRRARPASSCTRCQTFPGPDPTSGPWMILPSRQVDDAGELTGPSSASVLVMPHMLINPSTRTLRNGPGSSDAACRHGLIWDHTVFHVVASCRARPAWWLLRSATVGSPSGSPGRPNVPGVRTPARHVPGMSPSGRWFRGISIGA